MIETKQGLPNTCSQCGQEPGTTWYAANEDQARSGQGLCQPCAFPEPEGSEEPDDFTRIKGIGPARAAELYQLGLETFVELATAEHEGLVTAMEANPAVIRMWQSQAARLAEGQDEEPADGQPTD